MQYEPFQEKNTRARRQIAEPSRSPRLYDLTLPDWPDISMPPVRTQTLSFSDPLLSCLPLIVSYIQLYAVSKSFLFSEFQMSGVFGKIILVRQKALDLRTRSEVSLNLC